MFRKFMMRYPDWHILKERWGQMKHDDQYNRDPAMLFLDKIRHYMRIGYDENEGF